MMICTGRPFAIHCKLGNDQRNDFVIKTCTIIYCIYVWHVCVICWTQTCAGLIQEKKGEKKNSINALKSFISSENALHSSASLVCFVLFFTSTTMCFFWWRLQRYDIYKYLKAQVRWLNYRKNTPGSLSYVSLSFDRPEWLLTLISVKKKNTRQTLTLGFADDHHRQWSSGPQSIYFFATCPSDTEDIYWTSATTSAIVFHLF